MWARALFSKRDTCACEILISSLDDKGFFTTPPEELIGAKDKEYLDKVEEIKEKVAKDLGK